MPNLIYFIILVSSLIFVHELGHFVVAKVFGVKVLTFSLGFGPKVIRIRGKETEYCLGLLPLGGFVKMLEERKRDPVLPEDAKRTFEAQAVWKRVLIVLAGPVMNLVFPVLLYFLVSVGEGPFLPPVVGNVQPDYPAFGKLQPGDRVMEVNDRPIATFEEFLRMVRRAPNQELKLKIFRELNYLTLHVTPRAVQVDRELDIIDTIGVIGVFPGGPAAAIGIPDPTSPAYRAKLQTFDLIIKVGEQPIERFYDLEHVLDTNRGETVPVAYLRPVPVQGALDGLVDLAVFEAGVAALTPSATKGTLLERTGIESSDLYAAVVPPGSAEDKAQLRSGDKIVQLDGAPVSTWHGLRERLLADPENPHELIWIRGGRELKGTIRVRREDWIDEYGSAQSKYAFRSSNWLPIASEQLVPNPHPIRWALLTAIENAHNVIRFTSVGMIRLVQGKLSISSLAGPVTIYKVTGEEAAKGTDYFLWVMALVSVNLGLLNLLPIPVLDGGHLMFFGIEAVIRRPLPLRVREIASIIGMALLVLLMLIAFKNDLSGQWSAIWQELMQLM